MLFNTVELTPEETIAGMVLTVFQKRVIQNRMAELAIELVNTAHSKADETYFEKINFNKGQISAFQELLTNSEAAENYTDTKEN